MEALTAQLIEMQAAHAELQARLDSTQVAVAGTSTASANGGTTLNGANGKRAPGVAVNKSSLRVKAGSKWGLVRAEVTGDAAKKRHEARKLDEAEYEVPSRTPGHWPRRTPRCVLPAPSPPSEPSTEVAE